MGKGQTNPRGAKRKPEAASPHAAAGAAASVPPSPPAQPRVDAFVTLRAPDSPPVQIPFGKPLQQMAIKWSYVVGNRARWARSQPQGERTQNALEDLKKFNVTPDDLKKLINSGIVEVCVPYELEAQGWEGRVMPWEYLLNAATAEWRTWPILVVRHLNRHPPPPAQQSISGNPKLLLIESAPGVLADRRTFDDTSNQIISAALAANAADSQNFRVLRDPTTSFVDASLRQLNPQVIHVAAVDSHQAEAALFPDVPSTQHDGLIFRVGSSGDTTSVDFATAERIAHLLTANGTLSPALVGFNVWNSAARVCPLTVAAGAGAAVGFQDRIDRAVADQFFGEFYETWRLTSGDTLHAFTRAWAVLRAAFADRLRGTGIVLWSARSLVEGLRADSFEGMDADIAAAAQVSDRSSPRAFATTLAAAPQRVRRIDTPVPPPGTAPPKLEPDELMPAEGLAVRNYVSVDVAPLERLNYSLLHNGQPLFARFTLTREKDCAISDIQISVRLADGSAATSAYVTRTRLVDRSANLTRLVRVPLTSEFMRRLEHQVESAISVRIEWCPPGLQHPQVIHEHTYPVTLLPVDEWQDDGQYRKYLPSFVLPDSSGVLDVITRAEHNLQVLADDVTMGFDGYQSYGVDPDDPSALVDLQVRAIWAALLIDIPLRYINPPPGASTIFAQRLRTPKRVIDGARGTCIDLALLLAACLEYVDIYPVVFLLTGHAFVGYWRDEESYDRFAQGLPPDDPEAADADNVVEAAVPSADRGWHGATFAEVRQWIQCGALVPLEATGLTRQLAFAAAIEEGMENLRSRTEFDSLLDVKSARLAGVRPLPL